MIIFTPRDWDLNKSAWFRRPSDEFGGFSNMSISFPLNVLGVQIPSSEHLYQAMRFTLRTKLPQHVSQFGSLLKSTRSRPIVEWSRHDSFWGAGPINDETVQGVNVVGQLLTELRDGFIINGDEVNTIPDVAFSEAFFLGMPIELKSF